MIVRESNGNNYPINKFELSKDYCIKGTFAADEGNLREALYYFNKAVETDPFNYITYFNRATIKVELGDLEGARNDFKICKRLEKSEIIYNR